MNRQPNNEAFSDQLELLAVMGRDFATSLDIERTLRHALEHITMYMDAAGGALFLLDETGTVLTCHVCYGETEITGLTLGCDEGIVGRCVQNNKGEVIRDAAEDPNFHKGFDTVTGYTTRSVLCAPLSVKDQRIGAIELINRKGGDGLFSSSDLTMMEALNSSAALAILNARMAESLVEQERIQRELELAAEIQRSLLPESPGTDYPVHGINVPARLVSGDFYDFFPLEDGRICFSLGDVSGKGMNAALLMAKTSSLFRCLGKTVHHPGYLLSLINSEICETVTRGMFVTMVGGIYDPATGVVRLANAGHEPPLFHGPDGTFMSLPAEAPPLGIADDLLARGGFPESELQLDGGTLYVFTDGITEGYLENGKSLEVEGLKTMIADQAGHRVAARLAAIMGSIDRGEGELRDDLTIIAVDDSGPNKVRKPSEGTITKARNDDETEMVVNLTFPARADRLKLVRSSVAEATRLSGCSNEISQGIVIAIDEACQNIIRHAYGHNTEGDISVEIRRSNSSITVLIQDFADTIDVSTVKPRDLNDLRPGGLGTHFIREVMDEVEFLPSPVTGRGNLLKMVKRLT